MKNITVKDLRVIEKPKEEVEEELQIYFEGSGDYLWKIDGKDKIEYKNGKYYLNGEEAELITN